MSIVKIGGRAILKKAWFTVWAVLSFCSAREVELSPKISRGITYAWLDGFWQESSDVTKLKMSGCKLARFVPPRLENLHSLTISSSDFQEIDLTNLTNLTSLDIHWCPSLTTLKLSGLNKLENIYLHNGERLEHLELPEQALDLKKGTFCFCPRLAVLNLSSFPNLDFLRLQGLSSCCSLTLPQSPRVTDLRVEGFGEQFFSVLSLGQFTQLRRLFVEHCSFKELELVELADLDSVVIDACQVESQVIKLCKLPKLTSLTIARCHQLRGICCLDVKALEQLNIQWCNEFGWLELANFGMLKFLLLEWCPRMRFDLSGLVNLTSLTLGGCDCINLDLSDLLNLKRLSLTRCINLQPLWPQKLASLQLREYSNLNWSAHDLPLSVRPEKIFWWGFPKLQGYAEHRRTFIKTAKDFGLIRHQVGNAASGVQHLFTALLPILMRYLHGPVAERYFAQQMITCPPLQVERQGLDL